MLSFPPVRRIVSREGGVGTMSETVSSGTAAPPSSDDRNLAFLVYALLFCAPFVAGFTGLVGVVVSYVRRREAEPVVRTHYQFQIRVFWVAIVLAALACLSVLVGIGGLLADVINTATNKGRGWDAWDVASFSGADVHVHAAWVMALVLGGAVGVAASLWVMVASVFGLARLASHQPVGRVGA
jgi:uncharacterized membrane protein